MDSESPRALRPPFLTPSNFMKSLFLSCEASASRSLQRSLSRPAFLLRSSIFAFLMPSLALAMPGAPMLPLAAFAPGCGDMSAGRPVIVHPAEGPVYPNDLPDWAEVLQMTLMHYEASGEFERRFAKLRADFAESAESPRGAVKLPRAAQKTRRVIPFPKELQAFQLRMNAPESPQKKTFLLLDADDEAQRRWAAQWLKAEANRNGIALARVVVIAGERSRVAQALEAAHPFVKVLLDQGGEMRRMLGITALPVRAVFSLEGWEVETEVLEENA